MRCWGKEGERLKEKSCTKKHRMELGSLQPGQGDSLAGITPTEDVTRGTDENRMGVQRREK